MTTTLDHHAQPTRTTDRGERPSRIPVGAGRLGIGIVCLALLATAADAQVPQGDDFQVNSSTTDGQSAPAIATDADGAFVVVWHSDVSSGSDASYLSVQGQRFDADTNAIGAEFQVNSHTTNEQVEPAVALTPNGGFVVVWESYGSGLDPDGYGIRGQRFDADGNTVGAEFQVNSYTTNNQGTPAVAITSDGDFVIVWGSFGSSGTDTDGSVQGQWFEAGGNPAGSEFQVNTYTTGQQRDPSIAVAASGETVVVYESNGEIRGQRFDAVGTVVGDEFQVNTYTTGGQGYPAVAVDPDSGFVVAWQSNGSSGTDTSSLSVQGQRFDAAGDPVGSQFQANTAVTGIQANPAVAMDPDGDFVFVWQSAGSSNIQGQRFDADANPVGAEFQVNSYTTGGQFLPAVGSDADGDFVVVWRSNDYGMPQDDSIRGRRFRVTADLGDRVWEDQNADGLQNVGEPGIAGVTVHLRRAAGELARTTTTDGDGRYNFEAKTGTWYLEFELPGDYDFTLQDVGADDSFDSDADPVFGETIDIPVSQGVVLSQWDAGLVPVDPLVFSDGFESGNTSVWQ